VSQQYNNQAKRISSPSYRNITCSRHDLPEQLHTWRLSTITHSLIRSYVKGISLKNENVDIKFSAHDAILE
jgi:hypothetical protein